MKTVLTKYKDLQKSTDFFETRSIMKDYLIMLSAVALVSVFTYKLKALLLIVLSVLTCEICHRLGVKIVKSNEPAGDFSAVVTGLSIALLLPASAPWWMPVSAGIFAIFVCVIPFGTASKSPFVPAAAAVGFLSVCWSEKMFLYPQTGYESYFGISDGGVSIAKMLMQNNSVGQNPVSVLEILTGNVPSPIGAGCTLALFGACVYLIVRRPKNSVSSLSFILSVSFMAIAFPRVSTGRSVSLLMELCGGMMLFSAVFFMSYPPSMPNRMLPRALWGFVGGIICMLTRYAGFAEESVCFGILIMNALSEFFDMLPATPREKKKAKSQEKYIEILQPVTPNEKLEMIPDLENTIEIPSVTAGNLDSVISPENTVNDTEIPFMPGGENRE